MSGNMVVICSIGLVWCISYGESSMRNGNLYL